MEEQIEFDVKMKTKDMYQFLLYHTYGRISGWFGVLLSVISIIMLVTGFDTYDDAGKMVLVVIALAFTVVNPLMLLSKAMQQVANNPTYKKPLHYAVTNEGITISQDEQSQTMSWENIKKVKQFSNVLIVYTSKVHAFVFPLDQLTGCGDALKKCIDIHYAGKEGK